MICRSLLTGFVNLTVGTLHAVRWCKLDPKLKAPGFKDSQPNEENLAFNLKPGCLSLHHYKAADTVAWAALTAHLAVVCAVAHLADAAGRAAKKMHQQVWGV